MEIIIKAPEDFNKMCRSCLTVTTADKDLFNYHLIEDNQLTNINTIFESLTSLKVTVGDGLPESICSVCYKSLIEADVYRNRCLESEKKLKSLMETFVRGISTEDNKNADTTLIDDIKSNILHTTDTGILCELALKHELSIKNEITLIDNNANPTPSSSEKPKIKLHKEITRRIKTSEKQLPKLLDSVISKSCTLCDKEFSDACALSLHYLKHTLVMPNIEVDTSGYLFCEVCGQLFDCNSSLDQHYDVKHNGKIFWTCTECLSEFSTEMELLKHNFLHSSSTDAAIGTNFSCSLCDKRFSFEDDLLKHGFAHLVLKYNCKKCQILFCTQEAFDSHSKLNHGTKYYICHNCGKTLNCKNDLKLHIKNTHFSNKSHQCETCGKIFTAAATLKFHLRSHSTSKKFVCSYCDYTCHYQGYLKTHVRTHTLEKPYKCTFENCKKSFISSSNLKTHMKFHLNIRQHKCSVCSSSFITKCSLKVHMRQHSDDRPQFYCTMCDKKFLKKDSLTIHIKRKHEI